MLVLSEMQTLQSWTVIIAITVASFTTDAQLYFSREYTIDSISTRIFRTLFDVNIDECINNCEYTSSCSFVNYHRHTRMCYLIEQLDTTNPAVRKVSPGYISSDVSGVKSLNGQCLYCSTYEYCNNNTCVTQSCPPPNVPTEYQVSGNSFTIGSKLAYRCNGTDIKDTDYANYSTCLADGSWSDFSLSCYQGPPPGFETGTLSDGTIVTFKVFSNSLSQQGAMDACTSISAGLLQITSEPLFFFFQQVMNRQENDIADYWVDGERPNKSSPWLTSTGVPLPPVSNHQIWRKDDQTCVRMERSTNYRLNGKGCSRNYHYICQL